MNLKLYSSGVVIRFADISKLKCTLFAFKNIFHDGNRITKIMYNKGKKMRFLNSLESNKVTKSLLKKYLSQYYDVKNNPCIFFYVILQFIE